MSMYDGVVELYQSLWVMLRSCIAFSNVDALAAEAGDADLVD
jgi:hypothetical protein